MFAKLEGDTAVLVSGGVYKMADLYERHGALFAAAGGGFVRLYENGSTSKPGVQIETLAIESPLFRDRFGRLCVANGDGRTPLPAPAVERLQLPKD